MSNRFAPNSNGLVIVTLTKNYGSNVAGEKCGFLPTIAKDLVEKGAAFLPGEDPVAHEEKEKKASPGITSRKFIPEKPKVDIAEANKYDVDPTDDLRSEYKAVTGEDADQRWGEARLLKEIEAAKRARANA